MSTKKVDEIMALHDRASAAHNLATQAHETAAAIKARRELDARSIECRQDLRTALESAVIDPAAVDSDGLRGRLLAHADLHDQCTSAHSDEQAQWAGDLRMAAHLLAERVGPAAVREAIAREVGDALSFKCRGGAFTLSNAQKAAIAEHIRQIPLDKLRGAQ